MLVFLGGVALIALTFKLAYDMFQVPPEQALKIAQGKTLDLAIAGQSFGSIFIRILLLIVMGLMGSLVANRGISLYERSGGRRFYLPHRDIPEKDPE